MILTSKRLWQSIIVALLMFSCNNDDDNQLTSSNTVDTGLHKLYTQVKGNGNHTLVFESGLGDNYESWYKLSKLSNTYQTIAYNRAGYTPSEDAGNERGIIQLAEDLHQIIINKAENDKVTLVGHSLGGAIIRYYAIQHPKMVEALLFIDPSHESFGEMTQAEEDNMVNYFIKEDRPEIVKEAEQFIENFNILNQQPNLPDVPVVVLTSIRDREGMNKDNWINAHATLGEGITDFTHITTVNSGHYIQVEEHLLVLNAIDSLIK